MSFLLCLGRGHLFHEARRLNAWIQFAALLAAVSAAAMPLGAYMTRVFSGGRTWLHPVLHPVERLCLVLSGVRGREQTWVQYAASVLAFGLAGAVSLYLLLRPWMTTDLAFNTAVSFVTNTSWQSYSGERTLSYLPQMFGIAVQSFLSVGTSLAVAVALFRGIAAHGAATIGNFWVDLTRAILCVLLPLSMIAALVLASQGVIQNFHPFVQASTLENGVQTIAQGPVASQEAIKMLSADGGGFFNAGSAHPYENPTPFSNFFQIFLMLLLPAALTLTFGGFVQDARQGWAILAAMALLFTLGFAAIECAERGNAEGKEVRFGAAGSALFAEAATATSGGAANSAYGSYRPLSVLVLLVNMHTGEVVFGGPGSGMYSMILVVLLTVFIAGLMVGRSPEYLGQKIERFEIQMVVAASILTSAALLFLAACDLMGRFHAGSVWNPPGPATANFSEPGPHGFSEALYAFTSAVYNNGSGMGGLNANTRWYNLLLGLGMLVGRYVTIVPVLAIAGSLAKKKRYTMEGAMPTHGPVFVLLLTAVILLVTALTYLPSFFLGPLAEHFRM